MFKEKYYHVKNNYSRRIPNTIEFLGKNRAIEVRENWDDEPCIMVELSKELITDIPKSNEHMKTMRIEKSLFDTYYTNNLRFLSQNFPEQAEYYISSSSQELLIYGYTDKNHLLISVDNTINYFSCKIAINRGISRRNTVRKKHETISEAQAKQFFQLTLEYLYDRYTITDFKEDY